MKRVWTIEVLEPELGEFVVHTDDRKAAERAGLAAARKAHPKVDWAGVCMYLVTEHL